MSYPSDIKPDVGLATSAGIAPTLSRAAGVGYNPDVDTGSVPEDAWGGSGLYNWMTGLTSLEAVSTSPNDTATGTGARTVSFATLNGSYGLAPQTITLNGQTAVPVPAQALRNNGGRVLTAGATGTNEGDIILRDVVGGTIRGIILAGKGSMRQAPYTVPAGFTLYVRQIALNVDSPTGALNIFANIETYFRAPGQAFFLPLSIGNTNGQPYADIIDPPIAVAATNDFALRINKVSDNNAIVTARWNGTLRST